MKQKPTTLTAIMAALCALSIPVTTQAHDADPIKILNDSDVKTEHYLPDFSYAGYNHGMGDIPTFRGKVIDVTDFGVIADDNIDDSAAMLKALEAAHDTRSPIILQLPKGKVIISEILKIQRGDIVLRGAGSGLEGTNLHFPRPLKMVDKTDALDELREYLEKYDKRQRQKNQNLDVLFSEYSWSGGFIWVQKEGTRAASYLESNDPQITVITKALLGEAGSQTVKVDKAETLKVGDIVELQWFNRQGENGPLIKEIYGETNEKIGSHHWTYEDRPLVRQKTEILFIDGDKVTISDPLLHDISEAIPAQFSQWDLMTNVGIEDLHISFPDSPFFGHHVEPGYNGIYLTSVFNGWIRDVSIHNSDVGILTYNSANVTISNIETTGDRRAHYSVHAGNVHNMLVNNLTVNNPVIHSLSINTQSTKCVFQNSIVNQTAALDQHAGANHQNLFDNITLHVDAKRGENGPYYPIWDGGGAGYWQPGHGRFNTTWNLKVNVRSGADRTETVELRGLSEGPEARVIGVSGNRDFKVKYVPAPYSERINRDMDDVPSLYDYQLSQRQKP